MATDKPNHSSLYHLKRVLRLFAKVIIAILLLIVLIFILIQTPPVQNFARKKIEGYLEGKLQTRVDIGKLYIGFPNSVSLQNVYIEDRQKDTLLSGGRLAVDISLFKLIGGELEINEIHLENITAKIKRQLPDTTFNFQFIVDAFAPKKTQTVQPNDTAAMKMAIKSVLLDKVRVVYKDVITGNDMDVWVNDFTTRIDVFDPVKMTFDIPDIQVNGIRGRIYQSKPLVSDDPVSKDMAEAAQPIALNLKFNTINLQNIDLDYRNDVSAFYTTLKLGQLDVDAKNLDLPNQVLELDKLHLNKTMASIRMGNKQQAQKVAEELGQEIAAQATQQNWRIRVADLELNDNNIRFDDDSKPRLSRGMDYSHLKADNLTFHANDLFFATDTISAKITKGTFVEKSGFKLNRLETNFLFAAKEAYLEDLVLETPGTRITRSIRLNYPSLEAVAKNPANLQLNVDLNNSKVQVKDIITFVPALAAQPAFSNPNAVWLVDGEVNGSMGTMNIEHLQFRGLSNTRLDISGRITGMPDVNKMRGNLNIRNFTTNKTDLALFIPAGTLPQNITLPDAVSVNGTLNGGMQDVTTNLNVNTSLGNASIKGRIQQATDPKAARYNVNLSTRGLQLGRIMQNPMLGALSADLAANGRGFDPEVAEGSVKGTIHSAVFKDYNYRNVKLDASMAGKRFTANTEIHDPNIDLTLNASGVMAGKFPSLQLKANIDSLKAQELHLTPNLVIYRGNITADFANTDPDDLHGQMLVTHSVLVNDAQRIQLDSLQVTAGRSDTGRFLRLTSDVAWAAIEGEYKLTEIASVIQNSIQPHFALVPQYKVQPVSPYNFTVNATILDRPLLRSFMPAMKRMDDMVVRGNFSSTGGWSLTANSPTVVFGPNTFVGFNFRASSGANGIEYTTTLDHLKGGGFNVYGVNLNGTVVNNQVTAALNIKDRAGKDKYSFTALMRQPTIGTYVFSLEPQRLLLNYDQWAISGDNAITMAPEGFNVNNFVLSQGNQQLRINSATSAVNAPINVNFSSFRLGTITGFIQADTSFVDGVMNGGVVLNDVMNQLTFTSDLSINDLSVRQDTLGNATIRVNNTVRDRYDADVRLTGRGNDLAVTGNYTVKPNNASTYDLLLDIRQLQLSTLEGASMGSISDASGIITGRFNINGVATDPNINGNLVFNNAAMTVTMLNTKFKIDNERIDVNNQGITFNTFTVRDEAGNAIVINGSANTTNFVNYRFNMNINADNFQAVNSTKKQNSLFYGKLVLSTNLRVRGTEEAPSIDGGLVINKATDFTVVLPQQDPGVVSREGIVEFVDMDAPREIDSLFMQPYTALDTSTLKGFDVAATIEVDKEATLSMVVDAGNGDFVRMKGEGLLTGGIDPSGKITLTGSYEIQEGAYQLTFNFLQRKFNIQKGSRITWQGEPTDAVLDVTAIYVANTSPLDLVDDQIAGATTTIRNTYKQRLPFEVHLVLQGEMLKPQISFDIILPEENYNVSNDIVQNITVRLDQLRQEPSELNKQVFALLLLNRFVGENPFANSASSGFDAGSIARQSVSKLLTEQLNKLAENLIQGVDINFDVTSIDDYTTGERRNRTDFNVSLSKNLLSERLRVTVGSNFELEGPNQSAQQSNLAGDVAIDYKLSKDGRYMLRAYRKNEYEGVVEGYIIETGLSFIITVDYNKFAEIFRKKKANRNRRPAAPPPSSTQPAALPQQQQGNEPQNRE
jgi:translocation and assembly module TamB